MNPTEASSTPSPSEGSLIILGLGNTILTDDGVGIYVVRELQQLIDTRITNHESRVAGYASHVTNGDSRVPSHESRVTIKEASIGGFTFIDLLSGFDRAVILDAIHTSGGTPGEFYELDLAALKPSARLSSLHQIDFATACDLAQKMGVAFPKEIAIFVMEVADEFTFGERPTPAVAAAIPTMATAVFADLQKKGWLPSKQTTRGLFTLTTC